MTARHLKFTSSILALSLMAACSSTGNQFPGMKDAPAAPEPAVFGGQDVLASSIEPVSHPSEVEIEIYDPEDEDAPSISSIRRAALVEAAQSYGSQMGLARRSWEIEQRLMVHSLSLSEVYSFDRVVTADPLNAGYVVPPVISRAFDAYLNEDQRSVSVAEEYLTIVAPGKLVPVQPTWRDYLLMPTTLPERPAKSLFPRDEEEKELFDKEFAGSFVKGFEQADEELAANLTRLHRDYEGMLQYRRMAAMGMVDRLVLQDADFGVTGQGNEMRIGSRSVRIVSDAEFQIDPTKWSVQTITERDALIVGTGKIPGVSLEDLLGE